MVMLLGRKLMLIQSEGVHTAWTHEKNCESTGAMSHAIAYTWNMEKYIKLFLQPTCLFLQLNIFSIKYFFRIEEIEEFSNASGD